MPLLHGFELLRDEEIKEINSRALFYRHAKTGAELLSLVNDDENKVFGITFRTPPADSTGVAHIMEHAVLCGSRKYPVKEPFVELMKGSLNTFLNAMTYPDKTCYPVASQNVQDFYNLIDVYLDAVFYPNIGPFSLRQEGWHFDLDQADGEMAYKGVVYNEMKGAYSSPEGVLAEEMQHAIFPANTYAMDSGGDPVHIPDLTYAAFKDFHTRYYHPSNSRIFFYGDDDPEKRLEILDAYLREFEAIAVDSRIALQTPLPAPVRVNVPYEVSQGGEEPKALVAVGWLLPEGSDPELALGMAILEHVLAGNPAAPLYKALIDSGLGEDLTGTGMDMEKIQLNFSLGLKGVRLEDADKVERLILDTLTRLSREGIDPATVEASLNTVEFRLRERNTGSFPRGLSVMLAALEAWLYERDPYAALRIDAPLAAIKARVRSGERYFEGLLERHFTANPHRVTVVLQPDPALGDRRGEAERGRLEAARAAMSQADVQQVVADTLELRRRQDTPDSPEALATIPMLQLTDLDKEVRKIPARAGALPEIFTHDLFTNGILYLDLGFDAHALPPELIPYLPLFGRALTETGAGAQDFVQLVQRIGRSTGGIRPQLFLSSALGRKQAAAWFFLRGKAMLGQAGELLSILRDVLSGAHLDDRERFRQMLLEEKASLEAGLVRVGHRVVNTRIKSRLDEAGWAGDQTGGLEQLFFLRELAQRVEQDWPSVQSALEAIRERLLRQAGRVCNVTLDADSYTALEPQLVDFLLSLPQAKPEAAAWPAPAGPAAEGLTIPAQVNFVGKGGSLYAQGYQLHGSILAITNYLNSTWMWEKVRVHGGAYGGFAAFDQFSGIFSYLSYRDPNLSATLDIYDRTAEFLRSLELDGTELTKAIIGAVGELDAYQLPDAKGFTSLARKLLGVDDSWRQRFRDELLGTTAHDFHALGDALAGLAADGKVAILGSAAAVQAAAEARPGWLTVRQVL